MLDLPPRTAPGLLMCASRDTDAKLTWISTGPEPLAVKVPVTRAAGAAVRAEGEALSALASLPLGDLAATVPVVRGTPVWEGLPVLVTTALPGTSMAATYHRWRHTARRSRVRRDLALAGGWLADLQTRTITGHGRDDWPARTAGAVAGRWDGTESVRPALVRLTAAAQRLERLHLPVTAVHGDFWFGNVLLRDGRVSGVVDWEAGGGAGSPLRDLARFALSYSLYLDRHTVVGGRVAGHRGLRRAGAEATMRHALLSRSWYAEEVRAFLRAGLRRLGQPEEAWYDVALVGLGEVAAHAGEDDFAEDHLRVLGALPARPDPGGGAGP
ncbi:hypothetical protein GCM10027425_15630 [Alteromonas gracilis]